MTKYICCDMDGDCIRVYPANEESDDADSAEFWFGDYVHRSTWQLAAELFAEKQAKKIGAEWGCNY